MLVRILTDANHDVFVHANYFRCVEKKDKVITLVHEINGDVQQVKLDGTMCTIKIID